MKLVAAAALVSLFSAPITAQAVCAHDYTVRGLTIDHPWSRPTPGKSKIAAVYLKLVNNSKEADTLLSATSEQSPTIEIHETTIVDGIAKMRRLEKGVSVAANATVSLEPSGKHLMLFDLARPLKVGDKIPLTLTFQNRGTVNVKVNIETSPDTKAPQHHHH